MSSGTVRAAAAVTAVHVVLPDGVDDPVRPSGGNVYDRRICAGLAANGWHVRELPVPGRWPRPDAAALTALAHRVAAVPAGGLVLVDGLVGSAAPAVLVPESERLRLVVLVHMPLGDDGDAAEDERAVLGGARAVVTTSAWARNWLLERHRLPPDRVHVARPGVDAAVPVRGTPVGNRLLCVAAVVPAKGQDVLVAALADLADRPWHCTLVGPLDRDPDFVVRLHRQIDACGLGRRIAVRGPLVGGDLRREYAAADLLVLPSHAETYGMVVGEALAAGLPVIASDVGGLPEAVGRTRLGLPGLLVPAGDPEALAGALAGWLRDPVLRSRLRRAAAERRTSLDGWAATSVRIGSVLSAAAAEPDRARIRVPS